MFEDLRKRAENLNHKVAHLGEPFSFDCKLMFLFVFPRLPIFIIATKSFTTTPSQFFLVSANRNKQTNSSI